MDTYQDLNPRGLWTPTNFGGITYRTLLAINKDIADEDLRHRLFYGNNGDGYRKFYNWRDEHDEPYNVNMALISQQAKTAGIKFVVNNSLHTVYNQAHGNGSMPVDLFARATGHIADLMEEEGWTANNGAIALFNEPGKTENCGQGIEGAKKYVEFVLASSELVRGRFPLWIINDEYHLIDEEYVFTHLPNIPKEWLLFGTHHLSSLGKTPAWKHVEYAATQAATWGVKVGMSEGGAWFHPYRSEEGHAINVKLLEECARWRYEFAAIVCNINNEYTVANTWGTLGYLIYNNHYTQLVIGDTEDSKKWYDFNEVLKKYKEGGEPPMPEDRDIYVIPGYMKGDDVKAVQTKLRELGFDLKIDSWYGKESEAAVKKFQELVGVPSNGIVNANTKEMLQASSVDTFYPEVFKNIYESNNYSAEAIDFYLNTFGHPDLKGHGKYFVQAEQETGIPAEWQLANGSAESSYKGGGIGSSPIAQRYFNLFGWGIPDSGPTAEGRFTSFADCIPYVAKEIKRLFLHPDNWRYHGDHIFGIEIYYSTACYNAVNKANHYRKICKFLDAGIRYRVPEYMDDLIEKLDIRYEKKTV